MYSILNKTGKNPNDVPLHMRNVGLRSIHIGSFHMLSALLIIISTLPFRILALTQNWEACTSVTEKRLRRRTSRDTNFKNINNKHDHEIYKVCVL